MSRNKAALYDEDDLYDYNDEEDFYGDYGDYDPGEQKLASQQAAEVLPVTLNNALLQAMLGQSVLLWHPSLVTETCCAGSCQECKQ